MGSLMGSLMGYMAYIKAMADTIYRTFALTSTLAWRK